VHGGFVIQVYHTIPRTQYTYIAFMCVRINDDDDDDDDDSHGFSARSRSLCVVRLTLFPSVFASKNCIGNIRS